MSEQTHPKQTCPLLGLAEDRASHFSYPEAAHLCFAAKRPDFIPLEHQGDFCFSQNYPACPRFVELTSKSQTGETAKAAAVPAEPEAGGSVGAIIWGVVGLLVGLAVILGALYYTSLTTLATGLNSGAQANLEAAGNGNVNPTETGSAAVASDNTPAAVAFLATPTPMATPKPGVEVITLSPKKGDIGWA